MVKNIFLGIVFMALAMPIKAQNKEASCSATDKLLLEANFTAGTKNKGMSPMSLNFNVGYNFTPRFYAFAKAEGVIGLYDKDGVKTYTKGTDLGGGVGVKLFNPSKASEGLDFRASVANMGLSLHLLLIYLIYLLYLTLLTQTWSLSQLYLLVKALRK